MKSLSPLNFLRRASRAACFVLGASTLLACGPDFPNSYLSSSEKTLLAAPEGYFAVEIERMAPSPHLAPKLEAEEEKAEVLESRELRAALLARKESPRRVDALVRTYEDFRSRQLAWVDDRQLAPPGAVPADLPAEFSFYLSGAQAWHEGNLEVAKTSWRALLKLPAADRHYRSTWAAYMLARAETDNSKPGNFAEVRALAKAGFADTLNLTAASWGEEGRRALAAKSYAPAINSYLEQYAAGDDSAYASLRFTAAEASQAGKDALGALAQDARARRVLTAWHLARFTPSFGEPASLETLTVWTHVLAAANLAVVEEAEHMAWLAYEGGEFALAKNWAALASADVPETRWIRAKLALREGELARGAAELQAAADHAALAPIYRGVVTGELGRVLLALDRREDALRVWLEGDHWEDAAYVAEQVLTIDELKVFLAGAPLAKRLVYEPYMGEVITPAFLKSEGADWRERGWREPPDLLPALQKLLARRLVRVGRASEAGAYLDEASRDTLLAYERDVRRGFNQKLSARTRARAFWRAAQLAREEGMGLMATELSPDYAIWGGSFSWRDVTVERIQNPQGSFAATPGERERLNAHRGPEKRFSYRYRAAELAWWAASLLPNDSDETAQILYTAGSWLKARDPVAANPFYQALVIRCGQTDLGREAAAKRWFP